MTKKYKIEGMNCASCAKIIELDLEDAGIKASCNYSQGMLEVDKNAQENNLRKILEKNGYKIKPLK